MFGKGMGGLFAVLFFKKYSKTQTITWWQKVGLIPPTIVNVKFTHIYTQISTMVPSIPLYAQKLV
jgi:hypothetical protein